jgi:diaminohydroxyphosphoribosylaminopyrimidine deaminase/5-amino-6-(5-phosphoribosylamino)uracil reductase
MSEADVKYMQMALRLARRGIDSVGPNPAVGCIIVKANQIIGRGWHKKFGGPHAEITALQDCRTLGVNPRRARMYVTLEPCPHEGKTGPCTKAIIAAGVGEVFVATIDPSEHANGKGIQQLRSAGIEVRTGLCETEARLLNAPFIKFNTTGKCWVTLKWAQSIDGKTARAESTDRQSWISSELSRKDVHKLRRRAGAVLVGINTVIADNPLLTPRPAKGKKPVRVVLDSSLRIPLGCRLLRTARSCPVLVFTSRAALEAGPKAAARIAKKGAELLAYPDTQGRSNLYHLLDQLSTRGVIHLLVEGGPTVLASFLKERLADEICVYIAPEILGGSGSADISAPMSGLTEALALRHVETKRFGEDIRLTGLTRSGLEHISAVKRESHEQDRSPGPPDGT